MFCLSSASCRAVIFKKFKLFDVSSFGYLCAFVVVQSESVLNAVKWFPLEHFSFFFTAGMCMDLVRVQMCVYLVRSAQRTKMTDIR